MREVNQILNEILSEEEEESGKTKDAKQGTSYWYILGSVGNKTVCHTAQKTWYNGKYGFWSWLQTKYKNGTIKRTKFAKSATRKKAIARAEKLLRKVEEIKVK